MQAVRCFRRSTARRDLVGWALRTRALSALAGVAASFETQGAGVGIACNWVDDAWVDQNRDQPAHTAAPGLPPPGRAAPLVISHVRGSSNPPLLHTSLGRFLDGMAARQPQVDAVVSVHQGQRLTYEELRRQSDAAAAGLVATGVRVGDRVGMWSPSCTEWVIMQFATAKVRPEWKKRGDCVHIRGVCVGVGVGGGMVGGSWRMWGYAAIAGTSLSCGE